MTAVLSTTLFAEPVTQVQAADLHIVGATDAADATARSVPQVTTVAGATFGENDAIAVADTVTIDGRELRAGLWYWPVATAAADVNALAQLSAGGADGPYSRPANGATLEVGKRYLATTGTHNTPPAPADGDWFTYRNDSDTSTGGALLRPTVVGPLRTQSGQNIPAFAVGPGLEYTVSFNGTTGRWHTAVWAPTVTLLTSANSGQELRGESLYLITGDAAGMTFKMPATPAGIIGMRLLQGSTHPVTIEQDDTGAASQFLMENGSTPVSFMMNLANIGQKVSIDGEPFSNRWYVYRDWEIADINKNSAPWVANFDYVVGDLVTENRLSDGKLTIFAWDDSANNGGTPTDGTSGAVWDAAEEARWIEIGEAAVDLDILQSIEIDVRGYLSSWTQVLDVTLIDAAGNDYDSATDWRITGDSAGIAVIGSLLDAQDISHTVANSTRTVTLTYVGAATRRGLSAIRATHGHTGSTSGITRVKSAYFSGVTETYARTGGQTGTQTNTLTTAFDFITNPQVDSALNVQYMTAASGLFWYSRDNYRANEMVTLVTDADPHQVTIGNNSGLDGLKVIDAAGAVTETVNPALMGSTNSVDLDPLSIYHTWLDSSAVLHIRKVGAADTGAGVQQVADRTIDNPATGANPTSVDPIFLPHPQGSQLKDISVTFRDRRDSYDDDSRTTAPQTFTLGELQATKAGWTSTDGGDGYRQHSQTFSVDSTTYTYFVEYQAAEGGSLVRFQDAHSGTSNVHGGFKDFVATFEDILITASGGEATVIVDGTVEEILAEEIEPGKTYLAWITEDTQHGLLWKNPDLGVDDGRIQAASTAAGLATPFVTLTELAELSFPLIAARSLAQYSLYRVHTHGASTIGFTEQAAASAGPYDYDDEPASYDQLFGNVRNSGGTNFPNGVFQPTVTGTYRFTQELGITGNQVWANLGTSSGGSQILNNNALRLNDARESSTQSVSLTAGQNYWITTQAGGSTGRSSIRVKIALSNYVRKAVFSGDVEMPTSMHISSVSGNQTGNGFTSNGVYRSNNTGPLNGTGLGNWTWRVKVTRFGDFVQQMYWNDTANIAFRESFDGGTSWTGWAA